jgi:hypothetical protein
MSSGPSLRMKIGDFLLRRLKEAGVRHLFGVPGDFAGSPTIAWKAGTTNRPSAPAASSS